MLSTNRKFIRKLLAAVLSGVLLGLSISAAGQGHWLLGFVPIFALVPLLISIHELPIQGSMGTRYHGRLVRVTAWSRSWDAFRLAWISGVVSCLFQFKWALVPLVQFLPLSYPAAYVIYGIYAILAGLYLPILVMPFILNAARSTKKTAQVAPLWAIAAVCTAIEMSIPRFFPWQLGSLVQFSDSIRQWGSVFGPFFLTFVSIWSSGFLAQRFSGVRRSGTKWFFASGIVVAVWFLLWTMGLYKDIRTQRWMEDQKQIMVAVVQPAFGFKELSYHPSLLPDSQPQSFDSVIQLTKDLMSKSESKLDLVIWPAEVLDIHFLSTNSLEKVQALSAEIGTPILLSAVDISGKKKHKSYSNLSMLVRPDGSISEKVMQKKLIPFVQFLPHLKSFGISDRLLQRWFPGYKDWVVGDESSGLAFSPDFRVGPLVHFDLLDSTYAQELAVSGKAGILVSLINTSWMAGSDFGNYFLLAARNRALETQRTVVVANNAGHSTAFLPNGAVLNKPTKAMKADSAIWKIPAVESDSLTETFYVQFGNLPIALLAFFGLFSFLISMMRRPNL